MLVQALVSQRPEMVRRMLELLPEITHHDKVDFSREVKEVDALIRNGEGDRADLETIRRLLLDHSEVPAS